MYLPNLTPDADHLVGTVADYVKAGRRDLAIAYATKVLVLARAEGWRNGINDSLEIDRAAQDRAAPRGAEEG